MKPPWSPTDEQLTRFLRRECDAGESHAIQEWIALSEKHARRAERLRRLLSPSAGVSWNVDALWEKVIAGTLEGERASRGEHRTVDRPPPPTTRRRPWSISIAAALLVAIVGTAGWLTIQLPRPASTDGPPELVYETAPGQTTTLQLADGSSVRLAPSSRLVVPRSFGDSVRNLTLDGEAEFDVHHDTAHPFRVVTRTTVTEDIGTRFTVRAYRAEPKVLVSVTEGAVALRPIAEPTVQKNGPRNLLLTVGETGTLDGNGTFSVSRGVSVSQAMAWTRGQLVFDNQPLPAVLATISRWYQLDIRVADATVAAHRVTAAFSSESADAMLSALALAVDATVHRAGTRVTLRGR